MNPQSDMIARRRLLLGLLFSLAPGVTPALQAADAGLSPDRRQSSLLQRLRVPDPADPWQIDAFFNDYRVRLSLPHDLNQLTQLAPAIEKMVRRRIEFRRRNIDVLRRVALEFDAVLKNSPPTHWAQHEQTLEQVAMALPARPISAPASALSLHEPLLAALPAYTKVDFFLPQELMDPVSRRLRELGLKSRVRLHGRPEIESSEDQISLRRHTTYWMRDVAMASANRQGRSPLLLPLAFYQINDLSRPDNDYVHQLASAEQPVRRVPLFFKGGNLHVGFTGQRHILFIGQNELEFNQEFFYTAFFYYPPPDAVLELFQQLTGANEVRVLPNSKNLYHLDLVMAVIEPGTVALLEPLDKEALLPEDRHVLDHVRQAVTAAGFRIVGIPTLSDWVKEFKSPVNILPFRHRDSGIASVIVPQFEDRIIILKGKPYSIHEKIKQAYAQAGLKPIFATSNLYQLGGNFHCAVLPLR